MTTKYDLTTYYSLPVRITTKTCTRCAETGRDVKQGLFPVSATDAKGHFLCDHCLDELALEDFDSLYEKIPEQTIAADFEHDEMLGVPPTTCTRCGAETAIYTSRPKLGEHGGELCVSCHHIITGGVRGSMRT